MQRKQTHKVAYLRLRSTTGAWLVHPDLRPRLVEDALAQGINLTEVATSILAAKYGVPFEPNGRKTAPRSESEIINMRLPRRLLTKIRVVADRNGRQPMDEVRWALCEHYELPMPSETAAVA